MTSLFPRAVDPLMRRRDGIAGRATASLLGVDPIRLALFASEPVHFRVPLYRRLAADPRIDFTAIFASSTGVRPSDTGYGRPVVWDANLTNGYKSVFLRRAEVNPPVLDGQPFHAFRDIDIIGALLRGNYEVLWLWGYAYLTHMMAAATQVLAGRRILFGEDQTLLNAGERPTWKRMLKKTGLSMVFSRGHALYVGTQNYRWFAHYGVPQERLHFTPYFVDNERMRLAARTLAPQKSLLRENFGMHRSAGPVILFVGRLISKKQPLLLLEAFRRVRERFPCSLLIVGSGDLEGAVRRKIHNEQIPDVFMAGFMDQTELPKAYACADIFALPSVRHETWGVVVNEAMNFGLPIVLTNKVGSGADLVADGVNGYVVRADEPTEFAARLEELVCNTEMRLKFGQASKEMIRRWDVEAAAKGVLEGVSAVVGEKRWDRACGDYS